MSRATRASKRGVKRARDDEGDAAEGPATPPAPVPAPVQAAAEKNDHIARTKRTEALVKSFSQLKQAAQVGVLRGALARLDDAPLNWSLVVHCDTNNNLSVLPPVKREHAATTLLMYLLSVWVQAFPVSDAAAPQQIETLLTHLQRDGYDIKLPDQRVGLIVHWLARVMGTHGVNSEPLSRLLRWVLDQPGGSALVNTHECLSGRTPLCILAFSSTPQTASIRLLRSHGADFNHNARAGTTLQVMVSGSHAQAMLEWLETESEADLKRLLLRTPQVPGRPFGIDALMEAQSRVNDNPNSLQAQLCLEIVSTLDQWHSADLVVAAAAERAPEVAVAVAFPDWLKATLGDVNQRLAATRVLSLLSSNPASPGGLESLQMGFDLLMQNLRGPADALFPLSERFHPSSDSLLMYICGLPESSWAQLQEPSIAAALLARVRQVSPDQLVSRSSAHLTHGALCKLIIQSGLPSSIGDVRYGILRLLVAAADEVRPSPPLPEYVLVWLSGGAGAHLPSQGRWPMPPVRCWQDREDSSERLLLTLDALRSGSGALFRDAFGCDFAHWCVVQQNVDRLRWWLEDQQAVSTTSDLHRAFAPGSTLQQLAASGSGALSAPVNTSVTLWSQHALPALVAEVRGHLIPDLAQLVVHYLGW